MIISEDYLSIDEEISNDKKVFMKKDIKSIKIEDYGGGTSGTSYYLVISFKDSDDRGLVNEYYFEPIDQLNISRQVIVKQLRLKNYSVIDET